MRALCWVAGAAVALSIATGAEAGADAEGWWLAPLDRLTLRLSAADEHDRPYSLPVRPRQIAGGIALSCEYQEGRPCGDGVGTALELDSAAGWGGLVTAATRLRVSAGADQYASGLTVDRAYLKLESDPFALHIGRDVHVLRPSVGAALTLTTNPLPQAGLRPHRR